MPVLEYFSLKKAGKKPKAAESDPAKSPVLNEEEEKFLQRFTSEETPPPLPARPVVILDGGNELKGKDAQIALMDGADTVPLPTSPPAEKAEQAAAADGKKKKDYWSFLPTIPSKLKGKEKAKDKSKDDTADTLALAAATVKAGENTEELKKEEEDLSKVLDQLNLSAVNNRVFSFSKESEELMDKFKLVLKDLMNGAPTAYNDLESLLKNSEGQLEKMFNAMPPFLQTLVKSLPAKMTATLGPEFLAAASEKPGFDVKTAEAGPSAYLKTKAKSRAKRATIPSLKKLVSAEGAVATMLRSIMSFLKLRFPVLLTGTNVLLSLALFLLLFVFWYCHKRGRETRLEKDRLAGEEGLAASSSDLEASASDLEDSTVLNDDEKTEPPITIHDDPASGDKPSAVVADLPSVLELPEPSTVPLPVQSPEAEKEAPEAEKEAKIPK